ncbi:MAG: FAD-dependent oxidoreductase [bacterium]
MIDLIIDGKKIKADRGKTVLGAALNAGIYIPNLCYHPDLPATGACRLCIVEIEGIKGFPCACTTIAKQGMAVHTNTPELRELRKNNAWLILSEYDGEPGESTQLKKVIDWIGKKNLLDEHIRPAGKFPVKSDTPLFTRNNNLCILCERCVRMCQEVRKTGALGLINRGINTVVETSNSLPLMDAGCKFCLACVEVCPSGALSDKKKFDEKDREKTLLPCTNTCPAGIEVSRYVRLIAENRFQDALEVIREKVPFPAVLGYVCTHPCEEACRRSDVNEPIAIRALKRFAAEQDSGRWRSKIKIAEQTGKKVAVIGSGPAGLTAAWFLKHLGHSVTVFERMAEAGGMMRSCIPGYRLPGKVLDKEIKDIENIGVTIKTGSKIESLDELFEHFGAVFLALGAASGMKMGIPGEDSPRVLDGISVLSSINIGEKINLGKEIAVAGGGNVAIDAARNALRTGVKKVTILYRRTLKEMPAATEEVEEALKEGVKINFLVNPVSVSPEDNKLKVECVKMELGEKDASGRRRPVPIKGSEFFLVVDNLIMAVGQRPAVPDNFGIATDKRGRIQADAETLSCSRKGVFAGGDVVSGPASVIEAIQAGRIAACSIDKYLGGKGEISQELIPGEEEKTCLGRDEQFAYRKRAVIKTLPAGKRLKDFSPVEYNFDGKTATAEAERCLRCQLRLKITKAPFPPEKQTEK